MTNFDDKSPTTTRTEGVTDFSLVLALIAIGMLGLAFAFIALFPTDRM